MRRSLCIALVGVAVSAAAAVAQTAVPPASPTIGASGGFGGGIAIPVARLSDSNAAGYALAALIDFSAAEQPYSFRTELFYQRYDGKGTNPGKNVWSLGASLLARGRQSSAYAIGGIAVYKITDEGTKPGVNVGVGLEVPLTFFIGIADLRVHYVLSEGKPAIMIPITLGARF